MTALALCVSCGLLAQQSPEAEGLTPYVFTFNNGEEPLYALVNEEDLGKVSFNVLIDEPWNKTAYWRLLQSTFVAGKSPDEPVVRRERINAAWRAAGGVQVTDRNGNPYPVLQTDRDLAQRAAAIVDAAFPATAAAVDGPPPLEPGHTSEDEPAAGPGMLLLWGPHALVAAGTVLLAAVVLWLTFRRSWARV
jgi:hypothetical protein